MFKRSGYSFGQTARVLLAAGAILTAGVVAAESTTPKAYTNTKVAYRTATSEPKPVYPLTENNELVLGAEPHEDDNESRAIYGPVADYLSTVLGKRVVYKYSGSWIVYQGQMQKGAYDIVFDGAHFNSWRVDHTRHNVLVKVPGDHVFVVLVRKDNDKIRELKQLAGRTLCAHAPPSLSTLTALNEFKNAARQPIVINTDGWKEIYQGMLAGKCVAAVVPIKALETFEKDSGRQTKIVFRGATLPDNAVSAGPRVSAHDQEKIARALLSSEGEKATARLREKYASNKPFGPANNKEFTGLSSYLKNEWGY